MATNITIKLENSPGELARLGEALGGAGINIEGMCAVNSADKKPRGSATCCI